MKIKNIRRTAVLAASMVLIIGCTAGETLATLTDTTDTMRNSFCVATVDNEISEKTDKDKKTEIVVRNTGDIDSFIRVKFATYMVDENGDQIACKATMPEFKTGDGWLKGADGCYYYTKTVAPGKSTSDLLGSDMQLAEGQVVEVLTQSFQAAGNVEFKEVFGGSNGGCSAWFGKDGKSAVNA